jgi:hypothetical protein
VTSLAAASARLRFAAAWDRRMAARAFEPAARPTSLRVGDGARLVQDRRIAPGQGVLQGGGGARDVAEALGPGEAEED